MDDQSETIIPRLSVMGFKKAKIFKFPDERGNLFVFQKMFLCKRITKIILNYQQNYHLVY